MEYGTLEQKRALFDLVLESMESGKGLSMTKACQLHGIKTPSTFLGWIDNQFNDESCRERYRRALEVSVSLEADDIVSEVCDAVEDPRVNEFGVDKGWVEAIKLRANTRQWRNNGRQLSIDKQKENEKSSQSMDIGAITVNLIQDTRPKD